MVWYFALVALVMESCLAFPTYVSSRSIDYSPSDNTYNSGESYYPGTLTNFVYKSAPRGTKQYEDQSGLLTDTTGTVLMSSANILANNLVEKCIEMASIDSNDLMDCFQRVLLDEQRANNDQQKPMIQPLESVEIKREPLQLNPTGWRRKKRHLSNDVDQQQRLENLFSVLLQKRQKANPRFNPTGW